MKVVERILSDPENIKFFKENYRKIPRTEFAKKFNTSRSSIDKCFQKLNITSNKWNDEEIKILKEHYATTSYQDLCGILKLENTQKNKQRILAKASFLGLVKEDIAISRRSTDISWLLNDDLNTFYWIGFLLADGSFSFEDFSVSLGLSIKDISHLSKFAKLCSSKIETFIRPPSKLIPKVTKFCRTNAYHKPSFCSLVDKFDLKKKKTYNPPEISCYNDFSDDLLISLFIGFMDGDGCIGLDRGYIYGYIGGHPSWTNFTIFLCHIIDGYSYNSLRNPSYTKKGWLRIHLNKQHLTFLKHFISNNNLPVLERKWDKVVLS